MTQHSLVSSGFSDSIALTDFRSNESLSYRQLRHAVQEVFEELRTRVGFPIALVRADSSLRAVLAELSLVENTGIVILHNLSDAEKLRQIFEAFRCNVSIGDELSFPDFVRIDSSFLGRVQIVDRYDNDIETDTALLLATSGSTGVPKFVRLSRSALAANARSIRNDLGIVSTDVAITSLPISYSFGLSVLHSHLIAGAQVILSDQSIGEAGFWETFAKYRCTSFSGVPYTYQMLKQLRFRPQTYPHLRMMTQAGGKLGPDLVSHFWALCETAGAQFRVMYGQTEATARMAIASHEDVGRFPASAGKAISGSFFEIVGPDGRPSPPFEEGEVVFRGESVMLGYAQSHSDLSRADEFGGRLPTGDIGFLDDEGRLYLTGRAKRIAKVFGIRVSLDEVEMLLSESGSIVATSVGESLCLVVEGDVEISDQELLDQVVSNLGVNPRGVFIVRVDQFPRFDSGKIDYPQLMKGLPDAGS